MTTLAEISQQAANLKALFEKAGESAVKTAFREFFAANPRVAKICWTQSAPNNNDGDPSDFSVGSMCAQLRPIAQEPPAEVEEELGVSDEEDEGEDDEDCDEEYEDDNNFYECQIEELGRYADTPNNRACKWKDQSKLIKLSPEDQVLVEAYDAFTDQFDNLDELLRQVFGESVKVIATPTDIRTEEDYDY